MNHQRRNILGAMLAVLATPMLSLASVTKKAMKVIKIKDFNDTSVTLQFPDEETRKLFWVTFTDIMWPNKHREGKNGESFEKYYGPIISGKHKEWGSLTAPLHRSGYFDKYALEVAAELHKHGVLLEVIHSDKDSRFKMERVTLPKFREIHKVEAFVE